MARNIYSTRFLAKPMNTSQGFTADFVVPAGKVAVLKSFQLNSTTASWAARILGILTPGGSLVVLTNLTAQAATTAFMWAGSIVFNAGDTIRAENMTAGASTVTVWASGFLLTA